VRIVAFGLLHQQEVVRMEATASFRNGRSVIVRLLLTKRCDGVVCDDAAICTAGARSWGCHSTDVDAGTVHDIDAALDPDDLCAPGWASCVMPHSGACETNLRNDPLNCGACRHRCDRTSCAAGVCPEAMLIDLGAGGMHTCATTGTNQVVCWGSNDAGQRGVADAGDPYTMNSVVAPPDDIKDIACGESFTCARHAGGIIQCWGANESGQLARPPGTTFSNWEARAIFQARIYGSLGAGRAHACATSAGVVYCWGANNAAQLGRVTPTMLPSATPAPVAGVSQVIAVDGGDDFSCALTRDMHAIYCWGSNSLGQLGEPNAPSVPPAPPLRRYYAGGPIPHRVGSAENSGDILNITQFALGAHHGCAIEGIGIPPRVLCWGDNRRGQVGGGAAGTYIPNAHAVQPPIPNPIAVAAGGDTSCAVSGTDRSLYCWGANVLVEDPRTHEYGVANSMIPSRVPWLRRSIATVTIGATTGSTEVHFCARHVFGSTYCWGDNVGGELGVETGMMSVLRPVPVNDVPLGPN
jgi:alpha-tubulin suppressor-like RCC1 family protein